MGGGICFLFGPYPSASPSSIPSSEPPPPFSSIELRATSSPARDPDGHPAGWFHPIDDPLERHRSQGRGDHLLIVVSLVSCMTLKRKLTLQALFGTVAPIIAIQPLRFYLVYFMIFGCWGRC
jgi:hypothetical protein